MPERVPFRMTRDMVDGMGSSGTKGVFQRCAEETLRVLREDSEVIMTVLEVFKHDPLHSWYDTKLKSDSPHVDLNFVPGLQAKLKCSEFNEEPRPTRLPLALDDLASAWA